ncbi:hypothetical protein K7W42_18080 [Deinococcus sp. HMF7604]|uniref:hypothetical protein n=1 Tax=Deinococcus betulae TaxID=2873312 RepID=UPI001CCF5777|nr:hypothetical protein [Deinococcus betulae]MBZ9752753.1 hypothetical protein [Deinococcus betulae]
MQTYGIFGLSFITANIKTDKDSGRVVDFKWAFSQGVRAERKFTLEHIPTLKGAAQEGGKLRLEVTPRIDGTHLPSVDVPVVLRGNITIDADGAVVCTTRVMMSDLEQSGLSTDLVVNSTNCLECTVSNQPTLEEQTETQIQDELKNIALEGQEPLFPVEQEASNIQENTQEMGTPEALLAQLGFGQLSQLLQQIGRDPGEWSDPNSTNDQDAAEWRALLAEYWPQVEGEVRALLGLAVPAAEPTTDAGPVPPRVVLEPKAPGEDLPFELPDTDPAAD